MLSVDTNLLVYALDAQSPFHLAAQPGFARRKIIDARLAMTLLRHGINEFATANTRDFEGFGFTRVWNPL